MPAGGRCSKTRYVSTRWGVSVPRVAGPTTTPSCWMVLPTRTRITTRSAMCQSWTQFLSFRCKPVGSVRSTDELQALRSTLRPGRVGMITISVHGSFCGTRNSIRGPSTPSFRSWPGTRGISLAGRPGGAWFATGSFSLADMRRFGCVAQVPCRQPLQSRQVWSEQGISADWLRESSIQRPRVPMAALRFAIRFLGE